MKKLLSLLLILTMILSLCSCGGGNEASTELSKEKMLAQAEELDISDLCYEMKNNEARAKSLYNDKLVKIDNYKVEYISSYKDYDGVKMDYWANKNSVITLTAKLSHEDTMLINKGDIITVIGTLNITSSAFVDLNDAVVVTE